MEADVLKLYESDFYRMLDFECGCISHKTSEPEYSDNFNISFIRKGNFHFNVFRNSLDSYTGGILVTKPFYERTVTHVRKIPDECTILEFKDEFYNRLMELHGGSKFFNDNDIHSTLIKTNADTEFLYSF